MPERPQDPASGERKLYDISPEIGESTAVWPGDTPPTREVVLRRENGDPVTLSTLHSTVHVGAHADAPSHCIAGAEAIGDCPIGPYLGPCRVVPIVAANGERVMPDDLPGGLDAERILFATGSDPDPDRFSEEFVSLSPELIDHLHRIGVRLVGIDTPSIDPCRSRDLPAHHAAIRCGISILEGLVLDGVPGGEYELIALPLRLAGFDASPVRAVLRTL